MSRSAHQGFAAIAFMAMVSATSANAATVNVATDEGTVHVSEHGLSAITSVHGGQIDGLKVTATYADGMVETLFWKTLGDKFGGVISSGLSLTAYTTTGFMVETSSRLLSLAMDAAPASAVFDIFRDVEVGSGNTVGSSFGYQYKEFGRNKLTGEIAVTYENGLKVDGQARGTDTYTSMFVDYSGLEGGGLLGRTQFKADLDRLAVKGDLTPVPLPAGMPLLFAGIAGLGFLRSRKRS